MKPKRQPIYQGDGTALIPLTRGLFATVDAEDAADLCRYNWSATTPTTSGRHVVYAVRWEYPDQGRPRYRVYMHRVLCPCGAVPDHIDGNGLNNTRRNLRPASRSKNRGNAGPDRDNASGYRGVSLDAAVPRSRPWRAALQPTRPGAVQVRSYHKTAEEAALAYNRMARQYFGPFAYQNVVPQEA